MYVCMYVCVYVCVCVYGVLRLAVVNVCIYFDVSTNLYLFICITALKNIHINSEALKHLWQHFKDQIYHAAGVKHMLFNENDVDAVADMTQKTVLVR